MQVERFPPEHYEKIAETPMTLYPFDPDSKRAALAYGAKLSRVLEPLGVKAELFGSTELEISGKGEWEFALFLTDAQWYPVLTQLINHFKSIFVLDDDFTLFQDRIDGFDVEIIAMRGEVALRNQAIMRYWQEKPEARAAYEVGKREHAYSRRAYYRWKDELIAEILEKL
jgi:hypothetical protein